MYFEMTHQSFQVTLCSGVSCGFQSIVCHQNAICIHNWKQDQSVTNEGDKSSVLLCDSVTDNMISQSNAQLSSLRHLNHLNINLSHYLFYTIS